jgi:RimJ/RimL family protein N-acetyltransferase
VVDPDARYTDGILTIRRQRADDLEQHLAAIDDAQIDRLWDPGHRELWEAMSPIEQRAHQLHHLQRVHDSFGPGPFWSFSGDLVDTSYVVYVDCDLASQDLPASAPSGATNISYACHPAYRGRGYATRAVGLVLQFLREHTAATEAHFSVHIDNEPSRRVARAAGAREYGCSLDRFGRMMVRHVLKLRTP